MACTVAVALLLVQRWRLRRRGRRTGVLVELAAGAGADAITVVG